MPDGSLVVDGQRATRAAEHRWQDTTPPGQGTLSLIVAASVILKYRWRIAAVSLACGLAVAIAGLLRTPTYSSTATFTPQQGSNAAVASLSGIAAQFGVAVPDGDVTQSPPFYVDLLTARPILERLVDTVYAVRQGSDPIRASLQQLYGVANDAKGREAMMRDLRGHMRVSMNPKTSVVSLTIATPWPDLSRQLTERVLGLVAEFNLHSRQSQALAQQAFIQDRVTDARADLGVAEAALQEFLQHNRSFAGDPQLAFQHDRLEREVQLRQQIDMSLEQSLVQARIDAVRNTPVITIIQHPEDAVSADRRYLALKGIAAMIAAILLMSGVLIAREAARKDETSAREMEQLVHVFGDLKLDLARLGSRVRRRK